MSGQLWAVDSLGGYMYSENLSDELRHALQPLMQFRQHCGVEAAVGKNRGEKFLWNVYSDAVADGRKIDETEVMPETNFEITQGELIIEEYGNSVPYTGVLDAKSKHDVKNIIHKVMKNDAKQTMDRAAHEQFDATQVTVAPTSGTSTDSVTKETGGVTITNDVAFGKDHVKAIVDIMKEDSVPAYDGTNYVAVARPTTLRAMKNDLEAVHQYTTEGFQMILNGEIGRYEGTRFVEQTNVPSEGWTNGKSDAVYFMGDDTVTEGVAIPEEVRGKIPGDYGRSKGVAWYYLGGFGIVHNRADGQDARIYKWASAA